MEYTVILLSLGVALLLVGLIGKVKAKELEVGTSNKTARIILGVIGFLFIALSFYLFYSESIVPKSNTRTFYKPSIEGYRIDWCYGYTTGCGKVAADEFCQLNDFSEAFEFAIDNNVGEQGIITKVLRTGELCTETYCDSFEIITCR